MYNPTHANFPRAGFLRRLGAIIYDLLLAIAIYIFFGAIGFGIFVILLAVGMVDMHGQQHIADALNANATYQGVYQFYLALCVASFYALFWCYGGQTLGMRAWRIKVQHPNGQNLSLITAYARVVWSLLGIGNLWILLRSDKLALQDCITRSEIVLLSKAANQMHNVNELDSADAK